MKKKTILKIIAIHLGALVFLVSFGCKCQDTFSVCGEDTTKEKITLTYWRLWDDSSKINPLIQEFREQYKSKYPKLQIEYRKLGSYEKYNEEIQDAFLQGQAPDIFSIQSSWIPRYLELGIIAPAPEEVFTPLNFSQEFVDVASQDLVFENKIYGVPLSIDSLALFYNRDILASAQVSSPPRTWKELQEAVRRITQIDQYGNITRSGIALGTAKNVNRAPDVLSLLMLQNGTPLPAKDNPLFNLDNKESEEALQFYTDFANASKEVYTWNSTMHYSIDAFAEGKTAMILSYAYLIDPIKQKSPRLNFGISFAPQIKNPKEDPNFNEINFANYWVEVVALKGESQEDRLKRQVAWDFLKFLSSREPAKKYLEATQRPPAQRDLVEEFGKDALRGVFAYQALSSRSWFQKDNFRVDRIFSEMIDDVVLGKRNIEESLQWGQTQLNL